MTSPARVRRPRRVVADDVAIGDARLIQAEDGSIGLEVPDEVEGSRVIEKPPVIPVPSLSERVKEVSDRVSSLPSAIRNRTGRSAAGKPKAPKGPRQPVDRLIGTVWGIAARIVAPVAWPVANVLHAQAPVAGMVLEDVVRNTVVDTVLQPLAKIGKGGEVALALIGPPLLVGIMAAKPESHPVCMPLLKEALRAWLDIAGPKMIEHQEREAKFQEEYGQSIDALIQMFFTPPEGVTIPSDDSDSE